MTGYPYFPTTQAGFPWGYKIIIVNTKFLMCKTDAVRDPFVWRMMGLKGAGTAMPV
jgi:hypothetical protein